MTYWLNDHGLNRFAQLKAAENITISNYLSKTAELDVSKATLDVVDISSFQQWNPSVTDGAN